MTNSVASPEREKGITPAEWLLRAWVLATRYKFSCFLDDESAQLPHGIPSTVARRVSDELIVNSTFRYQTGSELPDEIQPLGLPMHGCLKGFPLAWILDPRASVWMPFWARGEYAEALAALRPGQVPPPGFKAEVTKRLAAAEILVPPEHETACRASREAFLESARPAFHSAGYLIVRDMIHPMQLGALRRHYQAMLAGGSVPKGDWIERRYGLHSELMATFLHLQLRDLVSQIAGERVKPSFVYLGIYGESAELPRHTDRPQCEFNISLQIDYRPEPHGPTGWPLYLENPGRPEAAVAADLGLGDAVFYRGREVAHYRHPLRDGHQATLLFLNYVREDFTGRLW